MYSKRITILNKTGLHARPASVFVGEAGKFEAKITLNKLDENGRTVKSCPAKSIVHLLSMALSKGTSIELAAEGPDESQAVDTLTDLIAGGFGEL